MSGALALVLLIGMTGQAHDVLARDPAALPTAAPETWAEWDPGVPPTGELREDFIACLRPYVAGYLPRSLDALYTLLEKAPDYPPALHQMGVVYFRLRRYGDAVTAFQRFLAHAPEEVAQARALGHSLYSLGRYEEALDIYQRVLAVAPDTAEAVRGVALARMRLGEDDLALQGLERVLALEPEHLEAQVWKARIQFDQERTEDALATALAASKTDPFDPRPWFLIAQARYELGEDEEGDAARARFQDLDRVAQEMRTLEARLLYDPAQPDVLLAIIAGHRAVGDALRVRKAFERLVKLDPTRFDWRAGALEVLEELDDSQGAALAALNLERHCGEVPEAWKILQGFYGRRGDRVRQVQAGERYLRLKE